MNSGFLHDKVVEHFEKSAELYSPRRGMNDYTDEAMTAIFKKIAGKPKRILEVGGGSGYLLELLGMEQADAQLVNCEITFRAYKQQVIPKINLVGGSAISLPFPDKSFDFVISKNLFHHIVGRTRKTSKLLAKSAALEMTRIVTSGGYLMIVEEYHRYPFFASIIFYLSLLFSIGNIHWDAFDIRPKVIISLLSPDEFRDLFIRADSSTDEIVYDDERDWGLRLPFTLFPTFFKLGSLIHVRKIAK